MKGTKNKSGISLIVLVITIIVIIILAVAVILTLSNNNPIENAKKAVSANDEAVKKEAATLAYADWYLKENSNEKTGLDAQKYVEDSLKAQGIDTTGLLVSNNGTIVTNAPTIPNGFNYLEGTVATGLVIKNSIDGNEFVWVPVEEGAFVRESFTNTELSIDYVEPYEEEGYTSEREEYDKMVASVSKYGGFYISRYEASKNATTNKAQSIADQAPWHDIYWGTSMTEVGTTGAVAKAREVYPDSTTKTTGDAVSILPYGVQWDATVRFLETNYPGIEQDSTGYGNYNTGSIINTGSNQNYALNNIYDIAGNAEEWTMESLSGGARVYRGGGYYSTGSDFPVSYRNLSSPDAVYIGFRLALYIK